MEPAKRYFGKVCSTHPELGGERRLSTRHCIQCSRNNCRTRRAIPANWKRELARQAQRVRTPQYRQWNADRQRNLFRTIPEFAISKRIRARIYRVLRGKTKSDRTFNLLGVSSIEVYKTYLEQQFQPGMTWENAGKAWHIDHRIPLSLIDLSTPEGQRFGFNYKNTRPMWADANRRRGNRLVFEDLL